MFLEIQLFGNFTRPCISEYDIVERGIVLSGGGALLKNLDYVVRQATGLPVFVAENPLLCVVNGCGKVLENMKMFRATLFRQDS